MSHCRERMEAAGKQSSSSSFTSDLFASNHSSSSSSPNSQILSSIFFPPAKVCGGESESLRLSEKENSNNGSATQPSAAKTAVLGEEEQSWSKEKSCSSYLDEEEKVQPFHYSSSIFYGAQDFYSQPQTQTQSAVNQGLTTFSKDVGEDDSGSASRGNWWQGSLYY